MSKMDDEWSIETPPKGFTPKRQKIDPEVQIKLTYPKQEGREDHMLHVLFLQTIMSSNHVDIRVLNKRGEALKESAVAVFTKSAFYQNHFNARIKTIKDQNDNKQGKIVVIHRIRGISKEGTLKQDKKVLAFLKQHSIHLTRHDWLEEEWDTRMIGFFTTVIPKCMPREYALKAVTVALNQKRGAIKIPPFQLQKIALRTDQHSTRGYGLEVRAHEAQAMMSSIKASIPPGGFVTFHLRSVNNLAYKKAIEYLHSKSETTWSFTVNYVSEGSFFKLEDRIKASINVEHIIYDPTQKSMKILVHKKHFDTARKHLKEKLCQWKEVLDPDDIRQFEKYPEIAHLTRDELLDSIESYTSHSIASILSFEIEEIEIKQPPKASTPMTTETTPSNLSDPVLNEKPQQK